MSKNSKGRGQINKIMIEKRIAYELEDNGRKNVRLAKKSKPNGSKPPWGEVPFDLDKWLQEIDPGGWMDEDKPNGDETKNRREGLESLVASAQIPSASIKDQFNTYYSILSRYFTPSDLKGKSLKDLDQMLQMFIKSNGGLF
jgi:hypothetical protein|tara:strand:+ start:106 stop:531 length:426 start_codon:yes stop_codon:yes gene_type:complete